MRQIHADVLQFRGSHYEFGYMQGKLLKNSLILKNRQRQHIYRKRRFYVQEKVVKNAITTLAPKIWEELQGLRDSLQWSIEDVLIAFGGYLLESKESGCSVFTTSDYMIRNYDFHPKTYEGRFVLFKPTDNSYATIGPTQHITGRMDGMNEKGLVIAYNFVHRKKPGDGLIPYMIARITLETCANTEEAITLIKNIPHFHSFSYIVLDPKGTTYIVEATPRGVEVRVSNICTNHFEVLKEENRYHLVDSYRRKDKILTQQEKVSHSYDAFRMMNDKSQGIFSDEYKNSAGTIHTSAYFPKRKQVWFALGSDRKPFIIDFHKWMTDENINVSRILGSIRTDEPFLHMDDILHS